MATTTTSTIIGLFESRTAAEHAADALVREGYSRENMSVVASDPRGRTDAPDIGPKDETGASTDAGTGAAVGGIAGFIGGMVALAIPGIGPIIAAGPLAAGIMGAGIGAASGGVIGALKSQGVPENDASRFAEAIRHGRVMVAAHVPSDRVDHATKILDSKGAIDVDESAERVPVTPSDRGGETPIKPLTPNAAEAAKLRPEDSLRERQRRRETRTHVYPGITGGPVGPTT